MKTVAAAQPTVVVALGAAGNRAVHLLASQLEGPVGKEEDRGFRVLLVGGVRQNRQATFFEPRKREGLAQSVRGTFEALLQNPIPGLLNPSSGARLYGIGDAAGLDTFVALLQELRSDKNLPLLKAVLAPVGGVQPRFVLLSPRREAGLETWTRVREGLPDTDRLLGPLGCLLLTQDRGQRLLGKDEQEDEAALALRFLVFEADARLERRIGFGLEMTEPLQRWMIQSVRDALHTVDLERQRRALRSRVQAFLTWRSPAAEDAPADPAAAFYGPWLERQEGSSPSRGTGDSLVGSWRTEVDNLDSVVKEAGSSTVSRHVDVDKSTDLNWADRVVETLGKRLRLGLQGEGTRSAERVIGAVREEPAAWRKETRNLHDRLGLCGLVHLEGVVEDRNTQLQKLRSEASLQTWPGSPERSAAQVRRELETLRKDAVREVGPEPPPFASWLGWAFVLLGVMTRPALQLFARDFMEEPTSANPVLYALHWLVYTPLITSWSSWGVGLGLGLGFWFLLLRLQRRRWKRLYDRHFDPQSGRLAQGIRSAAGPLDGHYRAERQVLEERLGLWLANAIDAHCQFTDDYLRGMKHSKACIRWLDKCLNPQPLERAGADVWRLQREPDSAVRWSLLPPDGLGASVEGSGIGLGESPWADCGFNPEDQDRAERFFLWPRKVVERYVDSIEETVALTRPEELNALDWPAFQFASQTGHAQWRDEPLLRSGPLLRERILAQGDKDWWAPLLPEGSSKDRTVVGEAGRETEMLYSLRRQVPSEDLLSRTVEEEEA